MEEGVQPTVMIVDDAPENLRVLSDLLSPHYRVRAATSGDKALRIAATPPNADLILLDVMMPGMDGYQVFERLRGDPATAAIPVIFVTAMDSPESELRGLDAGAVDYIAKPITPSVLAMRTRPCGRRSCPCTRSKAASAWQRKFQAFCASKPSPQSVSSWSRCSSARARTFRNGRVRPSAGWNWTYWATKWITKPSCGFVAIADGMWTWSTACWR